MTRALLPIVALGLLACSDTPASSPDEPVPVTVAADTTIASPQTVAAFDRVMSLAQRHGWHSQPYANIVQSVGEALIGTPYKDGLLDIGESETLVADLTAFDCVLYVENVLALARGIALEDYSFDGYLANLERLRYRDGRMSGYCSRLHYFTDWLFDNGERDQLRNITAEIGGEEFDKELDFMSENRDAYSRLVSDSTYACIVGMEDAIRGRTLYYVPQDRIEEVYAQLQAGDIIATTTHIGGLDVTHTGFVDISPDGGVGFLHASSTGEVKVATDLAHYIRGNQVQTGIVVARAIDPR